MHGCENLASPACRGIHATFHRKFKLVFETDEYSEHNREEEDGDPDMNMELDDANDSAHLEHI